MWPAYPRVLPSLPPTQVLEIGTEVWTSAQQALYLMSLLVEVVPYLRGCPSFPCRLEQLPPVSYGGGCQGTRSKPNQYYILTAAWAT